MTVKLFMTTSAIGVPDKRKNGPGPALCRFHGTGIRTIAQFFQPFRHPLLAKGFYFLGLSQYQRKTHKSR